MALHPWLAFDPERALSDLCGRLREAVLRTLSRKGVVVALSGGVDSSVCAAVSTAALGAERVFGLILPERESGAASRERAERLCRHLGIPFEEHDITAALEAIGCYRYRDEAIREMFPEFGTGWKSTIAISPDLLEADRINFFRLIVETPDGRRMEKRLPLKAYLQIVAATSFKQRIRKTLEYFHADRLNYAVTGTPNRLEFDQGFFVKNGDGAADLKPIAHLYKSQVYELGRALGLPGEILAARPSTDTYPLERGQEEFYFVLPYETMDLVLCGLNSGRSAGEVGTETGLTEEQVARVFRDIRAKRRKTLPLHLKPILMEPVGEVPS